MNRLRLRSYANQSSLCSSSLGWRKRNSCTRSRQLSCVIIDTLSSVLQGALRIDYTIWIYLTMNLSNAQLFYVRFKNGNKISHSECVQQLKLGRWRLSLAYNLFNFSSILVIEIISRTSSSILAGHFLLGVNKFTCSLHWKLCCNTAQAISATSQYFTKANEHFQVTRINFKKKLYSFFAN
jgi:hypothetical protein